MRFSNKFYSTSGLSVSTSARPWLRRGGSATRAALAAIAAMTLGESGFVPPAAAQVLEEIVVTARRTEENLMTVPLAVTSLSSQLLEDRGMKTIMDIAAFTPGFHFSDEVVNSGAGRANRANFNLIFRGNSLASGTLFIDGTPVAGNRPPPIADIERIEVLKGPQSVYFGRSTYTGAINYITRDPGDTFAGRATAEYSSFGSNEETLSLEGPIVENRLTARVSLSHVYKGGHYRNETNGNERLGQRQTDSGSVSLSFTPSDNLKIKDWANYYVDDDGIAANAALKGPVGSFLPSQLNCNLGGTRGAYFCGTLPDWDELAPGTISAYNEITPFVRQELFDNRGGFYAAFDPHFLKHGGFLRHAFQNQLRADYETEGGYSISLLAAYHHNKQQFLHDQAGVDGRYYPNPNYPRVANTLPFMTWIFNGQAIGYDLSEELRITSPSDQPLRWTFGGNYLKSDSRSSSFTLKPSGTGGSQSPSRLYPVTSAVFGGAYYDFTPDLTLSAEARYQWDHVKTDQIGNAAGFAFTTGPITLKSKFTAFSPRVTLDYRYTENSTVYALWSRGYLPGGFNASLNNQPQFILDQLTGTGAKLAYDQERLDNYEVGLKSTFLGGRARTTIALYSDKLRKGQVPNILTFTNQLGQGTILTVIQNLGAVDLKGLEFEGEFQVTQGLKLGATVNLSNSNIKTYFCSDCTSIYGNTNATGHDLQESEKVKYTIYANYEAELTANYQWYINADYTYRGPYFIEAANIAKVSALNNAGVRAGIRSDALTIEAYVSNLLYDKGLRGSLGLDTVGVNFPNEIRLTLPDKRVFGIKTSYKF